MGQQPGGMSNPMAMGAMGLGGGLASLMKPGEDGKMPGMGFLQMLLNR